MALPLETKRSLIKSATMLAVVGGMALGVVVGADVATHQVLSLDHIWGTFTNAQPPLPNEGAGEIVGAFTGAAVPFYVGRRALRKLSQ